MINKIEESLQWRYATKMFDATKKIDQHIWQQIENSLVLSPSSYGLQPWKFLIVQDPTIRQKLKPFSWNQSQVTDCSHYVVFLHLKSISEEYVDKFIAQIAKVRNLNVSELSTYKNMIVGDVVTGERSATASEWACRQSYISLGFAMYTAAMLQIDSCAIEGLSPTEYDKILNVDPDYKTVCSCAFGYKSPEDKYAKAAKVRFDKNDIISYI